MSKNIIIAPKGCKYLSDIEGFNELPVNCLFNKGKTGCGGTEVVLRGKKNAIIAVPYISLIINKIEKNTEHEDRSDVILGVHGDVTNEGIIDYLKSHEIKKIMVTYDSVPRLVKIIQGVEENEGKVFEDYFLLVDEWHCLFNLYDFRMKAIRNLLPVARKFKEVTFMTATPIGDNFIPNEIKDLTRVEVKWEDEEKLQAELIQTCHYFWALVYKIIDIINDNQEINIHIFLNSVSLIADILEKNKFPPDQVKIVCSTNDPGNQVKLSKINTGYTIAKPSDPPRKINFYTSTAFEGCDIFDENGVNIIVSTIYKSQTLLDVKTTVHQVCGRIRNSKYSNKFVYIYSTGKNNPTVTFSEFTRNFIAQTNEDKNFCNDLNNMSSTSRERILKMMRAQHRDGNLPAYITVDQENKIMVDNILVKLEVYQYYIKHHVFHSKENMERECQRNNIQVVSSEFSIYELKNVSDSLEKGECTQPRWADLFEEYHVLRNTIDFNIFPQTEESVAHKIRVIEECKPTIKKIYETIGIERIRQLEFDIRKINQEMVRLENLPEEIKLADIFSSRISYGKIYTIKQVNEIIDKIHEEYGLRKIPATKIITYFNHELSSPKIDNHTTRCVKFNYRNKLNF